MRDLQTRGVVCTSYHHDHQEKELEEKGGEDPSSQNTNVHSECTRVFLEMKEGEEEGQGRILHVCWCLELEVKGGRG